MSQEPEVFECPICHLHYADEETAKQCEKYCRENGPFSLDIAKHAVEYSPKEKEMSDES